MILIINLTKIYLNQKPIKKGGKTVFEKKDKISLKGLAKIIEKLKDGATPNHCRLGFLLGDKDGHTITIKDVLVPKEQRTTVATAEIYTSATAQAFYTPGLPKALGVVGVIFLQPRFNAYEGPITAFSRQNLAADGCPNLGIVVGKDDEIEITRDPGLSIIIKV
jgi:hypothetical protein